MMIHKQNNLVKVVRGYDTTPTSNNDIVIDLFKIQQEHLLSKHENMSINYMTSENGCKLDSSNQKEMWPLYYFPLR